ncbi:pseudouridine synthase [Schleiferilactobacillus harbinensis]|uniref:pseudouridine synthase n=1 Tax=Schleiferilactobacillus harbinensis TaxID=304207 RepID=UPI0039E740E9
MMRIDKFLAHLQLGSRAEVKKLLRGGSVTLNGTTVTDPKTKVDPDQDQVALGAEPLVYTEYVYYVMNKPADVITATKDAKATTVMDLLPDELYRPDIAPVGRLDKDTTGLLLLTNDGELSHRLLSPKWHVNKVYVAGLDAPVTPADVRQFATGIHLKDFTAAPAALVPLPGQHAQVTVHEGKFHQVKRMFGAVGKEVQSLQRTQFGPLVLADDLLPGAVRPLHPDELTAMMTAAQLVRK